MFRNHFVRLSILAPFQASKCIVVVGPSSCCTGRGRARTTPTTRGGEGAAACSGRGRREGRPPAGRPERGPSGPSLGRPARPVPHDTCARADRTRHDPTEPTEPRPTGKQAALERVHVIPGSARVCESVDHGSLEGLPRQTSTPRQVRERHAVTPCSAPTRHDGTVKGVLLLSQRGRPARRPRAG